jgi:hypothetical protein
MSLLLAPVDTSRYALAIEQIKQNDTTSVSDDNLHLFDRDTEGILKKYIYTRNYHPDAMNHYARVCSNIQVCVYYCWSDRFDHYELQR